jgi:hypothetical protein
MIIMASILRTASLALLAFAVNAAPTNNGVSTSLASAQTCITNMSPGSSQSASIPTSTRTLGQTISSTVTVTGSAAAQDTTVTPAAITTTKIVKYTAVGDLSNGTAETTTVYMTITAADSSCSSTTTVTANATTTVYTGSYNGTVAKRTASPLDKRAGPPLGAIMSHLYGEISFLQTRIPYGIDCLEQVTAYLIATSTIQGQNSVSTITASTPTVCITSTQTVNGTERVAVPASTVTSTITAGSSTNSSSICTTTTGSAKVTTTQHIKCAPTNLISSVDGYGIGQTQGHANETQGLADGSDPSACCQLCVDTANCAASEDDQGAGNCFLWYTSSPTCGLGFEYAKGSKNLAAGAGFLVQSGCGYIEPAASTS